MKALHWLFYLGCICTLFTACQDKDEPIDTPEDSDRELFAGENRTIILQQQTKGFHSPEYVCKIKAEDGTVFTRKGLHVRLDGQSILTLHTGLKKGIYRLLALEFPDLGETSSDTTWVEFGLGCRIDISAAGDVKVIDHYNSSLNFSGSGTQEDPYIISSYSHLKTLRNIINDQRQNETITTHTYFRQTVDIDMDRASWDSDHDQGWNPIGNQPSTPYRGVYDGAGYSIKNLWCVRPYTSGIGLFGFVEHACIKNVKMVNPKMEGIYAVGSIVGGSITAGDRADTTFIASCSTSQGYVKGCKGSVGNGGLIGVTDMKSVLLMDNCVNESTPVSGDYAVGGLLGAGSLYSYTNVQQSENHASISSRHTGAGGLVGSVDSLSVLACTNTGNISGSSDYDPSDKASGGFGTGGIAGGTGISFIYASINKGDIKGHTGVGGIIGSTRIGSDELLFNNALVKGCSNTGAIEGETAVGGICGESQFGGYLVYNTGRISAFASDAYVGGIVGNTSIAVTHNVLNQGAVTAPSSHCAGGIIGKTTWGAIFACQNYGDLNVSAHYAGGVVGLAGNYTMINYCSNMARIHNSGKGPTGGIIGEIGDPREWSALDIVSCVLGSVECVLGIAGPMIAVSGAVFKEAEAGAAHIMKEITHVLHLGETGLDFALIATETSIWLYGFYEMATEKELELMKSSLTAKTTEITDKVKQAMSDIRNGYVWSSSIMADGLTTDVSKQQLQHMNQVLAFYEASDENNAIVNYNINHKREERYEEIEKSRKLQEIIQKSITGACCIVGAVIGIAAIPFDAGSTAALVLASIGGVVTSIGGINAIVEGATDYQNNAVVVSQCLNIGEIKVDKVDKVGGILGHAQQFCEIDDCVNVGPFKGEQSLTNGGVVGRADSRSVINNCLNVGANWFAVVPSQGNVVSLKNSYYYGPEDYKQSQIGKIISLDELCDTESFQEWSFSGPYAKWYVENSKGYFPIPYHSEMEEAVEE